MIPLVSDHILQVRNFFELSSFLLDPSSSQRIFYCWSWAHYQISSSSSFSFCWAFRLNTPEQLALTFEFISRTSSWGGHLSPWWQLWDWLWAPPQNFPHRIDWVELALIHQRTCSCFEKIYRIFIFKLLSISASELSSGSEVSVLNTLSSCSQILAILV